MTARCRGPWLGSAAEVGGTSEFCLQIAWRNGELGARCLASIDFRAKLQYNIKGEGIALVLGTVIGDAGVGASRLRCARLNRRAVRRLVLQRKVAPSRKPLERGFAV